MISVYLVVKNEAKNIERVLNSITQFDDIVIVDSGSTDNTLELAKNYNTRLYEKEWEGMATQKEYAKNLCKYDWVLNLDADEELTTELYQEILQVVDNNEYNGANIPIQEHFLDIAIHPATKKNRHIRLFKKNHGAYGQERFHETPTVQGKIIELNGAINHYGEVSIEVKVAKANKYSSGKALDKYDKGKKASLLKLIFVMPIFFIKSYILKRNFLNGKIGFIGSVVNAFYAFMKEAKLFELEIKSRNNKE